LAISGLAATRNGSQAAAFISAKPSLLMEPEADASSNHPSDDTGPTLDDIVSSITAPNEDVAGHLKESHPSEEEIRKMAYQKYLDEGCPEGCSMEHWLQAEAELRKMS